MGSDYLFSLIFAGSGRSLFFTGEKGEMIIWVLASSVVRLFHLSLAPVREQFEVSFGARGLVHRLFIVYNLMVCKAWAVSYLLLDLVC